MFHLVECLLARLNRFLCRLSEVYTLSMQILSVLTAIKLGKFQPLNSISGCDVTLMAKEIFSGLRLE